MRKLFYIIVGLQIAFLLVQAGSTQIKLMRGKVVRLSTVPVDPRSLFMGHYAALSYDISRIDLAAMGQVDHAKQYTRDRTVYVLLQNDRRGLAKPSGVSLTMPSSDQGQLFIRGRIKHASGRGIWVDYGIDRYYIPEDKEDYVNSLMWGTNGRQRKIEVEAVLDRGGSATIRNLYVDGKPLGF